MLFALSPLDLFFSVQDCAIDCISFSSWKTLGYSILTSSEKTTGILRGIFYDYINTQNWDADFLFTQDVGESFLSIYPQIVKKSMKRSYAKEQKEFQK